MAAKHKNTLDGLARALVQQGRLAEPEADALASDAAKNRGGFAGQLIASGRMAADELAEFAATTFGYPLLDISAFDETRVVQGAIDRRLMQTHQVVGLVRRGNRLAVALADPTNLIALDEIRFQTGLTVDPVVVAADKLALLVEKLIETPAQTLASLSEVELDFEFSEEVAIAEGNETDSLEVDDAPVVKFIQKILHDAIAEGASDVHFEPYEKFYRIRYRTDGVLREITQPPLVVKEKIASRLKIISRLDISEKRIPQDGRMKLVLSKSRVIDFRVSTLPTLHGEKIVLRILDPASAMLGIDALGYEPAQKAAMLSAIARPYGMILVTGPTGSGKTVSLYTCLNLLNKPGVNISTAEDPAEINLGGVNQVNITERAGLSVATALRSLLRQDPDVIMVGEIRDRETADIAIKAAQTGHLVLSTLHTNDAPSTLSRLLNMGIAAFNIPSSVILITAQRLARRLCTCKQPQVVPTPALLEAGFSAADIDSGWHLFGPGACERCKGSGYKGRVGIYQVMPISETMGSIIMSGGNVLDIAKQARAEGVMSLRQSGLLKVKQGITSLEEILACTND